MQNENGNSIYKEKELTFCLDYSKYHYQLGNIKKANKFLQHAGNILKGTKEIKDVLRAEAICLDIYDANFIENNLNKISNKLVACHTAIKENRLFQNDKDIYLNDFLSSRVSDINKDSAFEKATKELILYLGNEKRNCLMNDEICNFFEIRQDKIRGITQEFKKERIAFLEKHIPQEKSRTQTKDNSLHNQQGRQT